MTVEAPPVATQAPVATTPERAPAHPGPEAATPPPSARVPGHVARWRPSLALVTVAAGLAGGQLLAFALVTGSGGASEISTALAMLVADALLVGCIWLAARRGADRLTASTLGIRRPRLGSAIGWSVAVYLAAGAAMALWQVLIGAPSDVAAGPDAGTGTTAIVLTFLVIAVTTPIAEELAFRGYLFPALTRWRGPWIGALVTAALFGLAHAAVYPPEILPGLAFMGLGLCLLFWITGSLLPCVAVHAFNNGVVLAAITGLTWEIPLVGLAAALVSVGLLRPFAGACAPQTRPAPVRPTAVRP